MNALFQDNYAIDAVGKRVIVIGSGDMATDCVATAVRMGCSEVIQFLETTKKEAEAANGCQADWHGKSRMFKIEYGQEEAIVMQGIEPREFGVR